MKIPFKRLQGGEGLPLPAYQTDGSAGMDLCAAIPSERAIAPGSREFFPCGFSLAIPEGFEGQVRSRSGLALKHGVTCLNTPGLIDSGYRGELIVLLVNLDPAEAYTVERGDRVAQLVVQQVEHVAFREVDAHDETERGVGGWGHTG